MEPPMKIPRRQTPAGRGRKARTDPSSDHPSPIQTVTVGSGIAPDPAFDRGLGLAGFTAGGDFHPAPKDVCSGTRIRCVGP